MWQMLETSRSTRVAGLENHQEELDSGGAKMSQLKKKKDLGPM